MVLQWYLWNSRIHSHSSAWSNFSSQERWGVSPINHCSTAVATPLWVIIKQLAEVRVTNNDSCSHVKNANTLLIKLFSCSHFTHLSSVFIKHKNYIQKSRVASNPYLYNIKAGCYIGEVLLNHLMFVEDICFFCQSARWLQGKLDVCQAYANCMGLFSTATKLFVWRLRLRVQKAQPLHYWNWVINTLNLF